MPKKLFTYRGTSLFEWKGWRITFAHQEPPYAYAYEIKNARSFSLKSRTIGAAVRELKKLLLAA